MPARLHVASSPTSSFTRGAEFDLPEGAARHAQVLRLQPGAVVTLFDGGGAEWSAEITQMGRASVRVRLGEQRDVSRELPLAVTLALGMPTNERMDSVVEKATELGVAVIQPLLCERSVLRLTGERAQRRREHWQSVAVAACEQCGRNRVPTIAPIETLSAWLSSLAAPDAASETAQSRWLLSTSQAQLVSTMAPAATLIALSGPEGGLSDAEQQAAVRRGFTSISLGPRILRADTAPLALLAHLGLRG